ncbi:MAG: Ig-like domain-containing protein, partial [Gemmatimonadaceae bacterium]
MKIRSLVQLLASAVSMATIATTVSAQDTAQRVVARLVAEPARVTLKAGETASLKVTAYDAQGNVIPNARVFVNAPIAAAAVGEGTIRGVKAGSFTAVAVAQGAPNAPPITLDIPLLITWPALAKLEIVPEPGRLYTGVMLAHNAKGSHADGSARPGLTVIWRSSDASVASVDRFGNVTAHKSGNTT